MKKKKNTSWKKFQKGISKNKGWYGMGAVVAVILITLGFTGQLNTEGLTGYILQDTIVGGVQTEEGGLEGQVTTISTSDDETGSIPVTGTSGNIEGQATPATTPSEGVTEDPDSGLVTQAPWSIERTEGGIHYIGTKSSPILLKITRGGICVDSDDGCMAPNGGITIGSGGISAADTTRDPDTNERILRINAERVKINNQDICTVGNDLCKSDSLMKGQISGDKNWLIIEKGDEKAGKLFKGIIHSSRLSAAKGVPLRLGDYSGQGNNLTVDVAAGGGLANLVAGGMWNAKGNKHLYTGTRGASRVLLHDGAVQISIGETTGKKGAAINWAVHPQLVLNKNGLTVTKGDIVADDYRIKNGISLSELAAEVSELADVSVADDRIQELQSDITQLNAKIERLVYILNREANINVRQEELDDYANRFLR